MTKARTLADFNTTSIPASVITGLSTSGGKFKQIVKTDLAGSSVDKTDNTPATLLTSTAITLSSASNELLIEAKISVDLRGGATHNNPEGSFILYDGDDNVLDRQVVYRSGTDDTNEALNLDTIILTSLYSPSSTTEAPYIKYWCDRGLVRVYGATSTVGRTSITVTEIAADVAPTSPASPTPAGTNAPLEDSNGFLLVGNSGEALDIDNQTFTVAQINTKLGTL